MSLPTTSGGVDLSLLHPRFINRLEHFFDDPRIKNRVKIVSAVRTKAHQQRLYDKYLSRGRPLAANPNRNIAPGFKGSWHMVQDCGFGYAVDLRITGRGLSTDDVARVAKGYGIQQTVPSEWWHFQPRSASGWFESLIMEEEEEPIIDWIGILRYIAHLGNEVALSPLRRGSRGKAVKFAQQRLGTLGFDVGTPDGVFGRKTRGGTIRFQRDTSSLTADGVIGGKTWQMMWESNKP